MNDKSGAAPRPLDAENREHLVSLLRDQRWGALATLTEGGEPLASSVAFAPETRKSGFVLHLSRLAEHTRNLLARPEAGLLVGEADPGDGDPQTLRRLSVQCRVRLLSAEDPDYSDARANYIARFPHAEPRFGFSDFELFFLQPTRAHYVGGFARAFALDADTMRAALAECGHE